MVSSSCFYNFSYDFSVIFTLLIFFRYNLTATATTTTTDNSDDDGKTMDDAQRMDGAQNTSLKHVIGLMVSFFLKTLHTSMITITLTTFFRYYRTALRIPLPHATTYSMVDRWMTVNGWTSRRRVNDKRGCQLTVSFLKSFSYDY